MFGSTIFRDQYGTDAMREVFGDVNLVAKWTVVESALATALTTVGLVPEAVAEEIRLSIDRLPELDLERMRRLMSDTGHPLMPYLICVSELLSDEASKYLHWGATTQDITDTAVVLQIREALAILDRQIDEFVSILSRLAREHERTPIAGRTHGQHAVPISYGLKVVGLAAEMNRHRRRLASARERLLVGQLGGAAGSLASLGDKALEVRRRFCAELGLAEPEVAWHSARDSLAEYVLLISLISMTAGRAALEVIELQRTEIDELAEPTTASSIGSSTMPQKENPMFSEVVVALARLQKAQPVRALDMMVSLHERDMSTWQTEWSTIAESSITLSAILQHVKTVYASLDVRTENMLRNLQATNGRINAEAAVFVLARTVGRPRAYAIVKEASKASRESGTAFLDELLSNDEIAMTASRQRLEASMSFETSAELAAAMVRDALLRMESKPDRSP